MNLLLVFTILLITAIALSQPVKQHVYARKAILNLR